VNISLPALPEQHSLLPPDPKASGQNSQQEKDPSHEFLERTPWVFLGPMPVLSPQVCSEDDAHPCCHTKNVSLSPAQTQVAHTCNPSNLGGRNPEDRGWKPTRANSWRDRTSKKNRYKTELVDWLSGRAPTYQCEARVLSELLSACRTDSARRNCSSRRAPRGGVARGVAASRDRSS
jgi:hypothetical protein